MKIKYRPHRGGLEESMALQKEFQSIEEMFKYIENESYSSVLGIHLYKAEDLSIGESLGKDGRIRLIHTLCQNVGSAIRDGILRALFQLHPVHADAVAQRFAGFVPRPAHDARIGADGVVGHVEQIDARVSDPHVVVQQLVAPQLYGTGQIDQQFHILQSPFVAL